MKSTQVANARTTSCPTSARRWKKNSVRRVSDSFVQGRVVRKAFNSSQSQCSFRMSRSWRFGTKSENLGSGTERMQLGRRVSSGRRSTSMTFDDPDPDLDLPDDPTLTFVLTGDLV
ncbi:unnamed protein product [Phytophthora fragariaefolia]|uniref:Unnamed protein product n=1 Tax=Phytophthora fragariaefolia TaxID=1490495 RepID=A0A9W7CWM2_9STRA|nr:unnamed protein product [Phytophthora fragariaefolia]